MSVGRKRKDGNPLGLERRVEFHHGQFRYLHPDGRKEPLGKDIGQANARARVYNDPEGRFGTLGYYFDLFNADAKAGRLRRKRAARTIEDNEREAEWLKTAFNHTDPLEVQRNPSLLATYLENRDAPVRGNREMAYCSAVFTWMIETGKVPGLTTNPVKVISRNPEKPKERYVEDAEFSAVYSIAQRSVCMAMDVTYASLQRPADVLKLGPTDIRLKTIKGASQRVLSVDQNKGRRVDRRRIVDIKITPELERALAMLSGGAVRMLSPYLVHDLKGKAYTIDGIGAMLRRYCHKAKVKPFGLMDIRAKGATDMYLAGIPLEVIQILMGHKSVTTTEIYIKRIMQTVVIATPNDRQISAGAGGE